MLKIEAPFHGAVLNWRHGEAVDGGVRIRVSGEAPLGERVTVNGVLAERAGMGFGAEVVLCEKENDIVAVSEGPLGRLEHRVRVVWDRYSRPRYRFSIDDNIFFLRDVAQKGSSSLFDCFYMKGLRDLNVKYGTKFVLNLFYETDDGFDLSQFPDRYRGEWEDNAGWLSLAFHAYAGQPDRPYQYAPVEKLMADWDRVEEQIHRFAGEGICSPPTVLHWGMAQPSALRPMAERGVRALSGYFGFRYGAWDVNYFLGDDRSEYLSRHDALMDFDSGIVFSRGDMVCNNTPVERVVPTLEPLSRDPNCAEIMDIFTHEPQFWPTYIGYKPDHFQRLDTALRWLTENGYEPVFFHEGFLGGRDWEA